MRHRRDYEDVNIKDADSTVGFLGTPYAFGITPARVGYTVAWMVLIPALLLLIATGA